MDHGMDHVDELGPSAEFVSVDRRLLITEILVALRKHEDDEGLQRGTCTFPTATWFSLWLADVGQLEDIAREFQNKPKRAWGLHKKVDSFKLVTMWLPVSGIMPKLPSIRGPSRPTSASHSAPGTPTTSRTARLPMGLVGTPTESSPARPSSRQESSPAMPSRKRPRTTDSPAEPGTPSDYNRETMFHQNCMNRDGLCDLAENTYPLEAARVCPFSLAKHKHEGGEKYSDFLSALSVFWSEEKIQKWLCSVETLAETPANALALTSSAHKYWDKALFALRPMSVNDAKTEMKLRFYWLKPGSPLVQGSSSLLPAHITEDYMVDPPILADGLEAGGRDHHKSVPEAILMLFNCQTRKIVCSGDEIIITTPDAVRLPLPDEELLRLQWTLHRLAALCAAAGFYDDSFHEDDDFAAGAPCVMTPPGVHEQVHDGGLSKHLSEALSHTPPLQAD